MWRPAPPEPGTAAWLEGAAGPEPLTIDEHVASRGDDVVSARWQLLTETIQVSDAHDGAVYLLCPAVVDGDGEWEAWLFANWLPGAVRHRSWWDLLVAEHQSLETP